MSPDYATATRRARALWNRHDGVWAQDADDQPVRKANGFTDVHAPTAVSFNRAGAIIRAIEEQVGIGQCTGRQYATVNARLGVDAAALGALGGSSTSSAKSEAARANGKLGGRPRNS